jgi:(p)ppGpp synthase/HD superfamily hydrolase
LPIFKRTISDELVKAAFYLSRSDKAKLKKAISFCESAHVGQFRKTGEPYSNHPINVALICAGWKLDVEALVAGLLHDTVEDTATTVADIQKSFGSRVAKLVDELTDVSKPEDGNRATRKGIDRAKLAGVSADAQTIKLADLISNAKDIAVNDPSFAKVYMDEKRQLLAVLTKGNAQLMKQAQDIVANYYEKTKK